MANVHVSDREAFTRIPKSALISRPRSLHGWSSNWPLGCLRRRRRIVKAESLGQDRRASFEFRAISRRGRASPAHFEVRRILRKPNQCCVPPYGHGPFGSIRGLAGSTRSSKPVEMLAQIIAAHYPSKMTEAKPPLVCFRTLIPRSNDFQVHCVSRKAKVKSECPAATDTYCLPSTS